MASIKGVSVDSPNSVLATPDPPKWGSTGALLLPASFVWSSDHDDAVVDFAEQHSFAFGKWL